MARSTWLWTALAGCDPYAGWPDPSAVFPWVYTPEEGLPAYADVRVETETWTPLVDLIETGLYVQKATYHRPSAPLEELVHFGELRPRIPPLVPDDPRVSFVGDVMRFGGNWAAFAEPSADLLGGLRVGNLETPTSRHDPIDPGELASERGLYAFNSPPELIDGLPLDVVQINNNHSLDLDDHGLEMTWREVVESGRVPIGMDDNLAWAGSDAVRVALLSYTWGTNVDPAGSEHDLHVIPFGHLDEEIDLWPIERQVRAARRAGATHVVLLVHWGFEYEYYPDPHFLQLGRALVASGADVVAGSGPHVVQPAEVCDVNRPGAAPGRGRCAVRDPGDDRPRTAAILYSLGDFGTELATLPLQVGIVATVSLGPAGVTGLGWRAVATVPSPTGIEVVPLSDRSSDPSYAAEAARLDALLGTTWKLAAD
ncbi:MAG: CapA family protein [Myxococcota bacterium]